MAQVKAKGMDEASLRDGRYDGILHLVTAADGAEEHYSLDNNEARSESVEMATNVSIEYGIWNMEYRVQLGRREAYRGSYLVYAINEISKLLKGVRG